MRTFWFIPASVVLILATVLAAQERPIFRVKVDMVVLSFTVTDGKGKYVNGLKHTDFKIVEDGIPQTLATFSEGNQPPLRGCTGLPSLHSGD